MVIEGGQGAFTKSMFKNNDKFSKCNRNFYSKWKHLFLIKHKVYDERKRVNTYTVCCSNQLPGESTSFLHQNYDL